MSDIAKSGTPSLATSLPPATNQLTGIAGEDLQAGDIAYVKASDGLVYRAGGGVDGEKYKYIGVVATFSPAGQACTCHFGVKYRYGRNLVINTNVFMSPDTPGAVADANAVNGKIIGRVCAPDQIQFFTLRA